MTAPETAVAAAEEEERAALAELLARPAEARSVSISTTRLSQCIWVRSPAATAATAATAVAAVPAALEERRDWARVFAQGRLAKAAMVEPAVPAVPAAPAAAVPAVQASASSAPAAAPLRKR